MRFLHLENYIELISLSFCSYSLQYNGRESHLNQIRLFYLSRVAWREEAVLFSWKFHPKLVSLDGVLHTTRIVRFGLNAFCECQTTRTQWYPLTIRIESYCFLDLPENLLFEWIHLHILILMGLQTYLIWSFYLAKTHSYPSSCEWHAAAHCFDWLLIQTNLALLIFAH